MRTWSTRLPRPVTDWAIPFGIFVVGAVDVPLHAHSSVFPGGPVHHLAFLAAGVVVLGLRRHAPLAAPALAIAIATAWAASWPSSEQGPFEGFLMLVFASYAIGSVGRGRDWRRGALLLLAFAAISQLALFMTDGSLGDLLPLVVWMAAAWGIGMLLSRHGEQAALARAHAAAVLAEQDRRTADAVDQERARIARELHDVVAHSLSVIVVQAAAERRALAHSGADAASVETVLAAVEQTGREALVDLRRLLGLLRRVDEVPSLSPQPSLDQIDGLLAPLRDAGLTVALEVDGPASALPAGVELTAYRIVQESLTNVLKHAAATRVMVQLRYLPRTLEIEVSDDGDARRADPLPTGGHGLLGMRERVHVFGGDVTAGPADTGGWRVLARLPVEATALEPA